jgi:hypothetical protein
MQAALRFDVPPALALCCRGVFGAHPRTRAAMECSRPWSERNAKPPEYGLAFAHRHRCLSLVRGTEDEKAALTSLR